MARSKRLTDTQLKLIQMFEFTTSKEGERELMDILNRHYIKKFNQRKKQLEMQGRIDTAKIDAYLSTHHHGKPIQA